MPNNLKQKNNKTTKYVYYKNIKRSYDSTKMTEEEAFTKLKKYMDENDDECDFLFIYHTPWVMIDKAEGILT